MTNERKAETRIRPDLPVELIFDGMRFANGDEVCHKSQPALRMVVAGRGLVEVAPRVYQPVYSVRFIDRMGDDSQVRMFEHEVEEYDPKNQWQEDD